MHKAGKTVLQIIGCLQDAPEEALAGIRMTFFNPRITAKNTSTELDTVDSR